MNLKQYIRKDNPFDYIVLGFIMKLLGTLAGFYITHYVADAVFGLFSWVLIIKGFSKIPEKFHFPFNKRYNFLLRFFVLLCVVIIIRGYMIDYQYQWLSIYSFINLHLFAPTYWLCYLMPFTVLIPVRYFNFRLILLYAVAFVFVTVILAFWYRNQILTASTLGAMGMGNEAIDLIQGQDVAFFALFSFVPLLCPYLSPKKWYLSMLGLATVILLMIVGARRGATLLYTILFLGSLYFYTLSKSKMVRWSFRIILVVILLAIVYFLLNSSVVDFLIARGMEDNRSGVEDEMLRQMDTFQLIFGKGLNGRYYFPYIYSDGDDPFDGWRYVVETGFYDLVLKGGYLFAFTYIILLLIPAYKGYFKSNNLLCKAGSFYLLFSLFSLWPFGILTFNLQFFFIWMMVNCCMNKEVLRMSDVEIKRMFFYNL